MLKLIKETINKLNGSDAIQPERVRAMRVEQENRYEWYAYLLDELEKANKVNENLIDRLDQADRTVLSYATSKGMNEELFKMMQEFDKRYRHSEFDFTKLQQEHTAMKHYLMELRAETSHDHIASQISNVLSTLSKEESK